MFLAAPLEAIAKPGLVAFLIVAGLGVATFFLLRSMTKQLRKIDFEEEPERESESPAGQSPGEEPTSESASGDSPGGRLE